MAGTSNQPPIRNQAGGTTDYPWQPLADCGASNYAFYHSFFDDMDASMGVTGMWTQTKTGAGTIANTPGDGGLALFTTAGAAGTDICEIQVPNANFTLTAGLKLFFETRLQLSDITNSLMLCGLIQTTTTPFTVTDGIYFSKVAGQATTINSAIGSVITSVTLPTAAYTWVNATNMDLAFYLNRQGDILAFIDQKLVGFIPQSGTGTQTPPNAGAVSRIVAPSLTAVVLNPTIALQAGTAAAKTLTLDFIQVQKER
jgi:hypothetical protein